MATIKYDISRTTATIIAGYFQLLFNIVGALLAIGIVRGPESCYTAPGIDPGTIKRVCNRHEVDDEVIFFSSMFMIACCGGVVLGIMMFIGIFKKSHELMAPFVHFGVVGLIGSGIFWILAITGIILFANTLEPIPYVLPCCLLTEGLQYALWYPVYSLYMELKEKANTTQNTQRQEYQTLLGSNIYVSVERA